MQQNCIEALHQTVAALSLYSVARHDGDSPSKISQELAS